MSLEISNIQFSWNQSEFSLSIPNLQINSGENLFIEGSSGSGKSTLLSLLCGINVPQSGSIEILGKELTRMLPAQRDEFRADHIGYIFQQFNLIPYLSVLENVLMGVNFSKKRQKKLGSKLKDEAHRLLSALNMNDFLDKPVNKLSIGQQQRVAAARALLGSPEIIICDEASSALDKKNCEGFIELIKTESKKNGSTLIYVSHDESLKKHFDRCINLNQLNES